MGVARSGGMGRADAAQEEIGFMFNETATDGRGPDTSEALFPTRYIGPAQQAPMDPNDWPMGVRPRWSTSPGCMELMSLPGQPSSCSSWKTPVAALEPGGYQVGPGTQLPPGTGTVPITPTPAIGGGFDLSGIFSGTILGLPSWLVLAAAAWFLFFRKGR